MSENDIVPREIPQHLTERTSPPLQPLTAIVQDEQSTSSIQLPPEPVITAIVSQIRAYKEGQITWEEFLAATQCNNLLSTPVPTQGQYGDYRGQFPSQFGLSATSTLPRLFSDPTEGLQPTADYLRENVTHLTNVAPFPAQFFSPQGQHAQAQGQMPNWGTDQPSELPTPPAGPAGTQGVSRRMEPYGKP